MLRNSESENYKILTMAFEINMELHILPPEKVSQKQRNGILEKESKWGTQYQIT